MTKAMTLCVAILAILIWGGAAQATSLSDGADRLTALQNTDGGWDWPLDDGNSATGSADNTVGPIAMGLSKAYLTTGDSGHLAALQAAASFLQSKTTNFSPSDGYLAVELDSILGGTANVDHVKTNFYDQLAAGTYDRNGAGTLYDTAGYVNLIRTARAGQGIANLAAWDIGMGLYSAVAIGASTSEWIAGVQGEIDELDGMASYDVIGLAGAVLGLASAGADHTPTAGEHLGAADLDALAAILVGYQLSTGGFTWSSQYLGAGNETIQETAYALLALYEADSTLYRNDSIDAALYMEGVQLPTGGWENYLTSGENNEITGEAMWGIATIPEPTTALLLAFGLGGVALLGRSRM